MFANGFTKRFAGRKPRYRAFEMKNDSFTTKTDPVRDPIEGISRAGDLDPDSAVCVTPDMDVAALFPLPSSPERMVARSYIYMVYVETGYATNTRQVLDALEGLSQLEEIESTEPEGEIGKKKLHRIRIMDIQQNLYGRELATDLIPATSICGAFKISRTWTKVKLTQQWVVDKFIKLPCGADYMEGGTYHIHKWVENPHAVYPAPSYSRAVEEFVQATLKGATTLRLPTTTDGYSKSTGL
jgi:hypothetical protein